MEVLQENGDYRIIMERHKSQTSVEVHERKTGMSRVMWHDDGFGNNFKSLRATYANNDINKINALFVKCGVEPVKIYKRGI